MRLIDADELLKRTLPKNPDAEFHCVPVEDIKAAPTIEPERKKGKWIVKAINTFELAYGSTAYEPIYECSLCGGVEESYLRLDEPIMPEDASFPKFCPNCGADMRGDEHETN